jgi:hypothetical protein
MVYKINILKQNIPNDMQMVKAENGNIDNR